MSNMTTLSSPQCCATFVCLVPAASFPYQGSTAQPLQMYMAPYNCDSSTAMSATLPAMLPWVDVGGSMQSSYHGLTSEFDSSFTSCGDAQQNEFGSGWFETEDPPMQQPMESQEWIQTFQWSGNAAFGEQTQRELQTPSHNSAHMQLSTWTEGTWIEASSTQMNPQVEVPTQLEMNYVDKQPQIIDTAAEVPSKLRQRRRKECHYRSANESWLETVAETPKQRTDAEVVDEDSPEIKAIAKECIAQFRRGGEDQANAIASFERLSFESTVTSRAAQLILGEASMSEAAELATGLRSHVRSAVQSKHANHVIQKITEVMPVTRASFIVDELKGFALEVARQNFGCRVLCRILEHLSNNDVDTVALVDEVFVDLENLCWHEFGSFVIRHILEFGLPSQRHRVVEALLTYPYDYANDKFGSHVVETALQHASLEDQMVLARTFLENGEQLLFLATNQYGRHVARALATRSDLMRKEVLSAFRPLQEELKWSRYGKSIVKLL